MVSIPRRALGLNEYTFRQSFPLPTSFPFTYSRKLLSQVALIGKSIRSPFTSTGVGVALGVGACVALGVGAGVGVALGVALGVGAGVALGVGAGVALGVGEGV